MHSPCNCLVEEVVQGHCLRITKSNVFERAQNLSSKSVHIESCRHYVDGPSDSPLVKPEEEKRIQELSTWFQRNTLFVKKSLFQIGINQ